MKKFILLAIALLIGSMGAVSASPLRFGLKAGVTVNSLHLNSDVFDSRNQTGFTGGAIIDFRVPVIGVGFDLSAMYVRRNARFMQAQEIAEFQRDYIDIPLNFKWNINIPAVGELITPFLSTGPAVSFLTSRRHDGDYKNKECDFSWNFGFGVTLLNKLQIAAGYGLGLTKAMKTVYDGAEKIDGKNRYWTITGAWFF